MLLINLHDKFGGPIEVDELKLGRKAFQSCLEQEGIDLKLEELVVHDAFIGGRAVFECWALACLVINYDQLTIHLQRGESYHHNPPL